MIWLRPLIRGLNTIRQLNFSDRYIRPPFDSTKLSLYSRSSLSILRALTFSSSFSLSVRSELHVSLSMLISFLKRLDSSRVMMKWFPEISILPTFLWLSPSQSSQRAVIRLYASIGLTSFKTHFSIIEY